MAENQGYLKNDSTFATRAIHDGNEPEQWNSMAVVPPISMATTFKQDGPADYKVSCIIIIMDTIHFTAGEIL